ncbi:hypothetical protein TIFTF001_027286 [Ficus carica]|uniref:Uncharacterized protein n=1 Tax=Ficus carica TaxID=3494 RepID=A0AA88DNX7_FICCA|nr:hypothetical protein TIFTF001_027286 [Ficus carica]
MGSGLGYEMGVGFKFRAVGRGIEVGFRDRNWTRYEMRSSNETGVRFRFQCRGQRTGLRFGTGEGRAGFGTGLGLGLGSGFEVEVRFRGRGRCPSWVSRSGLGLEMGLGRVS